MGSLRTLRQAAGLSQEQLAARADLSVKTIWLAEAGRTAPRRSTLRLLAEALGVTAEALNETGAVAAAPESGGADDSGRLQAF